MVPTAIFAGSMLLWQALQRDLCVERVAWVTIEAVARQGCLRLVSVLAPIYNCVTSRDSVPLQPSPEPTLCKPITFFLLLEFGGMLRDAYRRAWAG